MKDGDFEITASLDTPKPLNSREMTSKNSLPLLPMDATYDAQLIKETNWKPGYVLITDGNGRGKEVTSPMALFMKQNTTRLDRVLNERTG